MSKIKNKISELQIEELAIQSGFQARQVRKFDASSFLIGFFMMMQCNSFTIRNWAQQIASLISDTVSPQAVYKKLTFRHIDFVKLLLTEAVKVAMKDHLTENKPTQLFKAFKRVFVEDSTCVALPRNLAEFYNGPHSKVHGVCATAKVQLRMELTQQVCHQVDLMGYRNNDQSYANNIVSKLQPGDLVIRDRGYFVLKVFRAIAKMHAYFLSLLNYNTNLYTESEDGEHKKIDLLKILKAGGNVVDMNVLVGAEEKLPARLVAVKVPKKVALIRRAKAKNDRSAKANHSKRYLALLDWNIFITNVETTVWNFKDILKAYGLRWHIEIIFKCWKSKLDFDKLFNNQEQISPPRVIMTLYLSLIWIILFFARWYACLMFKVHSKTKKYLSILKFAEYVKNNFVKILTTPNLDTLIDHLAYYCNYDKRHRANFFDCLYSD